MLKILEIHQANGVQGEYIVLENQGLVTVSLRGWAICSDAYLNGDAAAMLDEMYIFREDVSVRPYTRVVLFTGMGDDGWVPTIDGKQAYCAYWRRRERIWNRTTHLHLIHLLSSRRINPHQAPELAAAAIA